MLQAGRRGIITIMGELADVKVLIASGRRAWTQRWAEMLRQGGAQVWLDPTEMPPDQRVDVLVADGSSLDPGQPAVFPVCASGNSPDGPIGVIRSGPVDTTDGGPDEVWLPEDVTGRELRLVCRLLARIVRLRRQGQSEAELRHRLSEEALTDPLTGLPNRRAWDQVLEERLATAADGRQAARRLCLAIFDLDHFKRINDTYGHAVGDVVLRSAGRAIRAGLRGDDFVARLGGDEFGLLLWVPDGPAAAVVVERVRSALPSRLTGDNTHAVTSCAGYCVVPAGSSSDPPPFPDVVYSAAAAALREAKRQGRDRTVGK